MDFEKFMVAARDAAELATTNMAWNMVEGVLHTIRRTMRPREVLAIASIFPPVVRALFLENWDPAEPIADVGSREDLLRDIRSLRPEHNFSPDNALESVGAGLRAVLPDEAFQRVLAALPEALRAYWIDAASEFPVRSDPPSEA